MVRSTRRPRRLALLVVLALGAAGCELIVDFDRTKIDAGGGDGSLPDVTTQDVTAQDVVADNVTGDVQQPDAGDAAADAQADAAADAAADVVDAAVDADDASDGATE